MKDKFSMLVYGQPGVGKTFLLGTAKPPLTPMLIADTDPGILTLTSTKRVYKVCKSAGEIPESGLSDDAIVALSVHDWDTFREMYSWLIRHPGVYNSVAWDSLTGLIELSRRFVLRGATSSDTRHDQDILEQRDYLRSQLHLETSLRMFLQQEFSLLLTGHVSMTVDPLVGEVISPDMPEGVFRAMIRKLDIVALYHTVFGGDSARGFTRRLYLQSDGRFIARSRLQIPSIDNPTMSDIYDRLPEPDTTEDQTHERESEDNGRSEQE